MNPDKPNAAPALSFPDPTLAPSRLATLAECPGYIGDVFEHDAEATEAADEGTMLHSIMESGVELSPSLTPEQREMLEWAREVEADLAKGGIWNVNHEFSFRIPYCANEAKIDVLMVRRDGRAAIILDWKFGHLKQASAEDNQQLRAYAAGIWNRHPGLESVRIIVAYPRRKLVDEATFTLADYTVTMENLAKQAVKCDTYLAHLAPGSACKRCGRKLACPAIGSILNTVGFPINLTSVDLHSPEQLGALRKAAGVLKAFIKEVEDWTSKMALEHGVDLPGFALRERTGTRSLTDPVRALELLSGLQVEAGLAPEVDWASLTANLGITVAKLESYLKDAIRAAHDGKPPRGALTEIERKLALALQSRGLVREGAATVYLAEIS